MAQLLPVQRGCDRTRWVNWSLAGGLLLVLLFLGSSDFSEKISAGKYPDYEGYQKRVPRFIPGLKWKS